MFPQNRARFLELLARDQAAALVFTGSPRIRNHDSDYRFRPHSDFYYLTGFREPDAVLLLVPCQGEVESVLFLNERDPAAETWTGRRLGVAAAPAALGVDRAHPVQELEQRLAEYLPGHEALVYRLGEDETRDRSVVRAVRDLQARSKSGRELPRRWLDPALSLHELRLVKGEHELERMRRAAEISAEAHRAVMRAARPGTGEHELDALLDYTFRRRGGTGAAYPNIVASGANACVLHYRENDRSLRGGELVLVDAGCEFDFYASDVTRTFPVGGRFSPEQRQLYQIVLGAQKAALAAVRPGGDHKEVHRLALEQLVDGLLALGLLAGTRAEVLESESYRRFYMHRTGHWLGLDVHDCGAYIIGGEPRPFAPGMVTTVEPGLYIGPEEQSVEARWRGIGIRIEDDVLVTATGHEVLTAAIPKEIDELEAACRGAALEPVG
jgi:Xaa-Pro aminopeptidase